MGSISGNVKKSLSDSSKKTVKQIVSEPFEILKNAKEQVGQTSTSREENEVVNERPGTGDKMTSAQVEEKKVKDTAQSKRLVEALENEIEDIKKRKQDIENEERILEENAKREKIQNKEGSFEGLPSSPKKGNVARKPKKGIAAHLESLKRLTERGKSPTG